MCPAVPAMYQGINKFPNVESFDLSTLGVCMSGSAPLPVEVLEEFERRTGAKITEGYGLTESSPVIHSNPCYGERKIGSIGIPLPDTDVKIVDLEDGVTEIFWNRSDDVVLNNKRLTYAELNDQVNRLATALQGMGVGKGTTVAIYMPNLPQTVISFFAVLRLGAVAVMTNPLENSHARNR